MKPTKTLSPPLRHTTPTVKQHPKGERTVSKAREKQALNLARKDLESTAAIVGFHGTMKMYAEERLET